MTIKTISSGSAPIKWDAVEKAFQAINDNFTLLALATGAGDVDLSNLATHVSPRIDSTYDLGSPSKQWRSLYVSNNTIYVGGTALGVNGLGQLTIDGAEISTTINYDSIVGIPPSINTSITVPVDQKFRFNLSESILQSESSVDVISSGLMTSNSSWVIKNAADQGIMFDGSSNVVTIGDLPGNATWYLGYGSNIPYGNVADALIETKRMVEGFESSIWLSTQSGDFKWRFNGLDGSVTHPGGVHTNQSTQTGTECLAGADTIVYTSISPSTRTIKLLLQFEGLEDGGDGSYHTHSTEMTVVKRSNGISTIVDATVYGGVFTSSLALATFDARWNATNSTIEITARPVSLTNSGWVKVVATEIDFGGPL